MPINQPMNQIKLTNLALVRMKKGKKRFEVACYKNKILDYKSGIETKIENVLQIDRIFFDVNKGQGAANADLQKAWGHTNHEKIIDDILRNGDSQVGEKERGAEQDRIKNEVVDIVASKLVDPKTKRVYTTGMIEKALDQLSSKSAAQQPEKASAASAEEESQKETALPKWSGIVSGKAAKSQALFAMKALIAHQPIPVARMRMKLRITCPTSILKQTIKTGGKVSQSKNAVKGEDKGPGNVKDAILGFMENVQSQDTVGSEWETVGEVEPGNFKTLNEFIESHTKGRGNVEVLDMAVGIEV